MVHVGNILELPLVGFLPKLSLGEFWTSFGSGQGGGFQVVYVHPRNLGKIPILTNIFQMGWSQQLGRFPKSKSKD